MSPTSEPGLQQSESTDGSEDNRERKDSPPSKLGRTTVQKAKQDCPYLDTIDRKALDFDFEKLCCVSLSKVNVYACLVCGKYFQGRGRSTHAFTHSISEFHHVYLNLETLKFYCLPDNYEIDDPSLNDILYVLKPTFSEEELKKIDDLFEPVKAYDGTQYYPGIVGLNNLKHNDYCNVIFQALSHVIPLRDHFLLDSNRPQAHTVDERYLLQQRFGELIRKLWNPRNFKAHVSPHEMLQAIVLCSKKNFEFTKQSDPIIFLSWFLNSLIGPKRERSSIIKRSFEGKIKIFTRLLLPNVASTSQNNELILANEETCDLSSFLFLTLDLPAMPLFAKKDKDGQILQPSVSIDELLKKFNGRTKHEFKNTKDSSVRRYEVIKFPRYLILYFKRFTKNNFFVEKNTHIVDFPMKNLNLSHLLSYSKEPVTYDLIANIVHDGEPSAGKGTYRVHILHRGTGKWFELQDLYVTEIKSSDTTLITFSETYIQIWELKT